MGTFKETLENITAIRDGSSELEESFKVPNKKQLESMSVKQLKKVSQDSLDIHHAIAKILKDRQKEGRSKRGTGEFSKNAMKGYKELGRDRSDGRPYGKQG